MYTYEEAPPFKTFFPTVLILSTVAYVATDIYLPSLPSIRESLKGTNTLVQLSLSFYLFALSLSQLFFGPLSDRFGRRKIAIFGLAFSFVGSVICIASFYIYMLLIGRILQGLALGSGPAVGRACIRDVYAGDRLARFGSLLPIGISALMVGIPVVGGYIQHYLGWRINFVFILLYTFIGLGMVFFWLPETNKHINTLALRPSIFIKNYLHLLKSPIFMGYSLCGSLTFGGLSAYFAASPFLFQEVLGLTPVEYGWLAFILGGGIALGGYCNSILVKKYGRHRMLVFGVFILILAGSLMLIPTFFGMLSVFVVMLPMFLYGFGSSATFANSFAGAFHPFAKIAGFAGALFGCVQVLGGSVAIALIAMAHEKNQLPLSILLLITAVISYFLQLIAFKASVKMKFH